MNRMPWLCLLAIVTCLGCGSSEADDVSSIDPALCAWEEALSAEDLTDFSDFTSFSFRRPGAFVQAGELEIQPTLAASELRARGAPGSWRGFTGVLRKARPYISARAAV